MTKSEPTRQKPVTLETRKSLLYGSNKRRSVKAIVILSLFALIVGFVIALLLKQVVEIDVSAPHPRLQFALAHASPTP